MMYIVCFFFFMLRRPSSSTLTDTLLPYTTLFRSQRALVGAGVGGLAGGAIGAYQDRQEAELRRQMQGTGVDVVRQGDNITLNMPGGVTFAFDKAEVQPQFYPVLDNVAGTLQQYNQTIIEVAGHTDSVGTDSYNQQLSQQLAERSDNYLKSRGVMRDRMIPVRAGETRPIPSKAKDRQRGGRAKRVQGSET